MPLYFHRGAGSRLWDVDGNEYIDFAIGQGALLFGHAAAGLAHAIAAQARKSPVPVDVDADNVGRYPQEVEAAVYFCSLEALQNVAKYAHASRASIKLTQINGSLTFEVADDGDGFDPTTTGYGTGLQGMADRLDAIGGTLVVRSEPGHGTSVTGRASVGSLRAPIT